MKNEVIKTKTDVLLNDISDTKRVCQMLMETPHYRKMGAEGIFAVVEKAKSIGVSPIDALNGGLYFVQGKVEMTSSMMNQLIRTNKHSITKDKRSDDTICILHGKRADNGDTWTESFSIEDAKVAGIYKNQWVKYPKDMLFARALSRLARQLFPDVIKGCYVQGEISEAPSFNTPIEAEAIEEHPNLTEETKFELDQLSKDEVAHLNEMIGDDIAYRRCVMAFLERHCNVKTIHDMPRNIYEKIIPVAESKYEKRMSNSMGMIIGEEEQMIKEA